MINEINNTDDVKPLLIILYLSLIGIHTFSIDTPEIRGKCQNEKHIAKIARNKVREVLNSANAITLKDTKRGKYFRIIAKANP